MAKSRLSIYKYYCNIIMRSWDQFNVYWIFLSRYIEQDRFYCQIFMIPLQMLTMSGLEFVSSLELTLDWPAKAFCYSLEQDLSHPLLNEHNFQIILYSQLLYRILNILMLQNYIHLYAWFIHHFKFSHKTRNTTRNKS